MHPAYSVIFFTTVSGAGYGLLALLSAGAGLGLLPPDPMLGFCGLGLALALVTAGLLSSTFHLGHPERAWRALSQWRSSWLSREGVLALATYVPAAWLGIAWVFLGRTDGLAAICGGLTVALALLTVTATGMIYASLPTIRQWHQPLTVPVYLVLAAATGALLLASLLAAFGYSVRPPSLLSAGLLAAAAILKLAYWRAIDATPPLASTASAIGLASRGPARQLDPPHSQPNFVMREMGYAIARKHALKLRRLVIATLFILPIAEAVLAALVDRPVMVWPLLVAVLSGAIGVATERWLFFAEAEHVALAYYGGSQRV